MELPSPPTTDTEDGAGERGKGYAWGAAFLGEVDAGEMHCGLSSPIVSSLSVCSILCIVLSPAFCSPEKRDGSTASSFCSFEWDAVGLSDGESKGGGGGREDEPEENVVVVENGTAERGEIERGVGNKELNSETTFVSCTVVDAGVPPSTPRARGEEETSDTRSFFISFCAICA